MATQYIIGQERQNQIPNYKHFNWGIKHLYAIPLYPGFFSLILQISVTVHLALYAPRSQGCFAIDNASHTISNQNYTILLGKS